MSNTTSTNPWNADEPFAPFFCDEIEFPLTPTTQDAPTRLVVPACVFPIDDVDPLADDTIENKAKKVNVIVKQIDLPRKPEVGDSFTYDSMRWNICEVDRELTWYRLVARGGLS